MSRFPDLPANSLTPSGSPTGRPESEASARQGRPLAPRMDSLPAALLAGLLLLFAAFAPAPALAQKGLPSAQASDDVALPLPPAVVPPTAQTNAFEAYALPRPADDTGRLQAGAGLPVVSSAAGNGASARSPRAGTDTLALLASMTLFPGSNDLSLTAGGTFRSQAINAQLNPLQWGQGNFTGSYFQAGQGQSGLRLGTIGPLPVGGTLQGLRLSSPWGIGQTTFGLGLYQQIGGEGHSLHLAPALDAQWHAGKNQQGSAILATDASWQVSQRLLLPGGQFLAVAGRDASHGQGQVLLALEQNLRRFTVFTARVSAQDGESRGALGAMGLTQRLGAGYGILDTSLSQIRGQRLLQTGLGLFLPLRGQALGLRWQHIAVSEAGGAFPARSTELLTGTCTATLNPKTNVWSTVSGAFQQQARFEGSVVLGFSRELNARWSVQSEITQALEKNAQRVRLSLGCQVTPDWQLRLLCGPALRGVATSQAFGVQVVHRFRVVQAREGKVRGQVMLDGKPCTRRIQVQLDEDVSAATDAQGRFLFRHVPPGGHAVHLKLEDLPACLDAETPSTMVSVAQGKTEEVRFALREVGQAEGSVRALADTFGQIDPTAAQGVVVQAARDDDRPIFNTNAGTNGNANAGTNGGKANSERPSARLMSASTNAEDHFTLGGLGPGRHILTLDMRTLPPGYRVVGPARIEITVTLGKPCPPVEFVIAPRAREIEYTSGL